MATPAVYLMSSQTNQLTYRADVDGLRALAVLSVMVYHAFPELLPGGFIGVDVFFVISGFLISQIILTDLAQKRFSFCEFYSRRVRRIFPALLVVLVTILVVSWATFLPFEFAELNKQVLASIGFVLNFVLWKDAGYFDTQAELKPFLHLWSLAIEEQFYLLWPLILWLSHKTRAATVLVIGSVLIGSFFSNVWYISANPSATFYFPVTRIWELALGALLAWIFQTNCQMRLKPWSRRLMRMYSNIWVGAGLALIIASSVLYSKSTAYPGWWALLPTLGAGLAIVGGKNSAISQRLLAHPILVGIGLISYPLYLWHWPILVIARILSPVALSELGRLALLIGAVPLAWITYRLVETPIRRIGRPKEPAIILLCCATIVASISFINYQLKGETVVNQFNVPMNELEIYLEKLKYWRADDLFGQEYHGNATRILVLGDSHGWDYYKALANDKDLDLAFLHLDERCVAFGALTKIGAEDQLSHCNQLLNLILNSKELKNATVLLHGMKWDAIREWVGAEAFYLASVEKILQRNPSLRIVVFGPKPFLGNAPVSINQILRHHHSILGLDAYLNSIVSFREADILIVKERAKRMNLEFIDVVEIFCAGGCTFFRDGQLAYFDYDHWTEFGAKIFFEKLKTTKFYKDLSSESHQNLDAKDGGPPLEQ